MSKKYVTSMDEVTLAFLNIVGMTPSEFFVNSLKNMDLDDCVNCCLETEKSFVDNNGEALILSWNVPYSYIVDTPTGYEINIDEIWNTNPEKMVLGTTLGSESLDIFSEVLFGYFHPVLDSLIDNHQSILQFTNPGMPDHFQLSILFPWKYLLPILEK